MCLITSNYIYNTFNYSSSYISATCVIGVTGFDQKAFWPIIQVKKKITCLFLSIILCSQKYMCMYFVLKFR